MGVGANCGLVGIRDGLQLYAISGWTLLDGAEFNFGYTLGFGLVSVDYANATLPRYPKWSYHAWASFLSGGLFQPQFELKSVAKLDSYASVIVEVDAEVVEDVSRMENSIPTF